MSSDADAGRRIRQIRLESGVSLRELARRVGKDPTTIVRIESGKMRSLGVELLASIADALGTTSGELMTGTSQPTDEDLANRLRALREARNLKQGDIAARMGWRQVTVSRIETGRRSVAASELPGLAAVLGTSVAYLLGVDDEDPNTDALRDGDLAIVTEDGRSVRKLVGDGLMRPLTPDDGAECPVGSLPVCWVLRRG